MDQKITFIEYQQETHSCALFMFQTEQNAYVIIEKWVLNKFIFINIFVTIHFVWKKMQQQGEIIEATIPAFISEVSDCV